MPSLVWLSLILLKVDHLDPDARWKVGTGGPTNGRFRRNGRRV
jgi:hypothetical protein